MRRDKLEAAQQLTERFIDKRLRANKPFQSLILTPQFEKFQKDIKKAIKSQLKETARRLNNQAVLHTTDMIDSWLQTMFPPISKYLDRDEVYEYLLYCFVEGVRAQYGRLGLKTTATKTSFNFDNSFDFELTNQNLIDALNSDADYLLSKSAIDATTRQQLIDLIQEAKLDNATIDEIASTITDAMPDISDSRAFVISRTETARAMGQGNYQAMVQNGVQQKQWVAAGSHVCAICQGNVDDGLINVSDSFSSGDDYEPAHPNCECYTQAGEINLDSIDIWDGS